MRQRFEIVEIDKQGNERILNDEFLSHVDAIKAAAYAGLPDHAAKIQVRTADTKEFVWEMFRKTQAA